MLALKFSTDSILMVLVTELSLSEAHRWPGDIEMPLIECLTTATDAILLRKVLRQLSG